MSPHTFLYDINDILLPEISHIRVEADGQTFSGNIYDDDDYKPKIRIPMRGKAKEPIEGIDDRCAFYMEAVRSMLAAPGFRRSDARSSIITGKYDMLNIELNSGVHSYLLPLANAHSADYMVNASPLQIVPNYVVNAVPTKEGTELMKYWRREMLKIYTWKCEWEPDFFLFTTGGSLMAEIEVDHRTKFAFRLSNICQGAIAQQAIDQREWLFTSRHFDRLLPFHFETKGVLLRYATQGLLAVEIETTHCDYTYYFPARHR